MGFRGPSARRVELLDVPSAGGGPARPAAEPAAEPDAFDSWRSGMRAAVLADVEEFVADRCAAELDGAGVDIASDVLVQFVTRGKCLRSTFAYLGWLYRAGDQASALRAAASFELLHGFALLQDDVMDVRRGRPSAHVQFCQWHRARGLSGSARRFGESAAVLLADLCLVWAAQMLRGGGLPPESPQRAWPRYDAIRTELVVGQFADPVNDARGLPTLGAVLEVARRKSGNYTVRRPLEIGAALAGCDNRTIMLLGNYGAAVGEAFQLRDDLLGVFGAPSVTGKPSGGDLSEHKATTVVVAAYQMADATIRHQLAELMSSDDIDDAAIARWLTLIVATGAVERIEEMIAEPVTAAREQICDNRIDESVRAVVANISAVCTVRIA